MYSAAIQDTTAIFRTIERFGALLGRRAQADDLAATIRDTLESIGEESYGQPRPAVFYSLGGDPPRTAGAHTFVSQMIRIAGGELAFPGLTADWPTVSIEAVVERQPDVLLIAGEAGLDLDELATASGWRDLNAVRDRQVIVLPADLFNRPGPSIGLAARALREALEPLALGTVRP